MLEEGYYDWGWVDGGSAVCAAPGGQLGPRITTDGAGGALVTWFDSRAGTNFDIYAMRLTAHAPAAPGWPRSDAALCQASGDQLYPRIAADGEGGAFVAWTDQRTSLVGDIYVQRVASIGVRPACWPSEGLPVCALATSQESPIVVANGRGRALVAWTDGRNGPGTDIYAAALPTTGESPDAEKKQPHYSRH